MAYKASCTREQSISNFGGGDLRGNGKDAHAPIGLKSNGDIFRELLDFDPDFTGMYQFRKSDKAWLVMRRSNQTHINRGGNARVILRRITSNWDTGGGHEGEWLQSADEIWPGPSDVVGVTSEQLGSGNDNGVDRIDISDLFEKWLPSSVLKRDGQPGTATAADIKGIEVQSFDEGNTTRSTEWFSRRISTEYRRPYIEWTADGNQPPSVPVVNYVIGAVSGTSGPTIVGTVSGKEIELQFLYADPDNDPIAAAELRVYPAATADPTNATPTATTGGVYPVKVAYNTYRIKLTGLPAKAGLRWWLRARDSKGRWSEWTDFTGDTPWFQTAYKPGAPLKSFMQTKPDQPHIFGTLNGPGTISRWGGEFYEDTTSGVVAKWAPDIQVGGGTRSDVLYAGTELRDGMRLRWRHWHYNEDGVKSDPTGWLYTPIKTQVGPSITPADTGTKLTSRTGPVTLAASSFDGYQYKLYRDETLIYTSAVVTVAATTSTAVTLYTGKTNWGDTLGISAAVRPAGTTALSDFSPITELYFDALPSTTLTASDGDGFDGPVLPTLNPRWAHPFTDPDAQAYGDVPLAGELMIRQAADPAGSGALISWRTNAKAGMIPETERTGEQLNAMTSAAGITTDANVTATTVASAPTLYSGSSLRIQATGGSSTDRKAILPIAGDVDLSEYGSGTPAFIWYRVSSVTNLTRWLLRFYFAGGHSDHEIVPSTATINVWTAGGFAIGAPTATSGTVDWSTWDGDVHIVADVSGAYTGDLDLRDLRIGRTQTGADIPTGDIAPEASVDARARWRDDAALTFSTTLDSTPAYPSTTLDLVAVAGLAVGMDITVGADNSAYQETRTIVTVGTAGGNNTVVDANFLYGHNASELVRVFVWGAWTPWLTRKLSLPPVIALTAPAQLALVVDPTPDYVHTASSPGGKAMAYRTLTIWRRQGYVNRVHAGYPAALWTLGDTSGAVADDYISTNDGTYTGGYTLNQTGPNSPASSRTAVLLNGTSGYVTIPTATALHPGNTFSLEAWVKKAADGTDMAIVSAGNNDWQLRIGATNLLVLYKEGIQSIATSLVTVTGTDWHHIVATKAGATMALYIDGVIDPDATFANATIVASTVALAIGRSASSAGQYWNGTLGRVAVYPRAITAAEVSAHFASRLETPGDALLYEPDIDGTGLTDTGPTLLLEDATAYAWTKTVYDTDALPTTPDVRVFSTQFVTPAVVADLTATADTETGSVTLAWTASADAYLDHYRVYWRDGAQAWLRIDAGPVVVDDGRVKLTTAAFTHYGGRLGDNQYRVTVHNGSQESDPADAEVTLSAHRPGSWQFDTEALERYTFAFDPDRTPRTWGATIERFDPPGRGYPVLLSWGSTGRHVRVSLTFIPSEDGDLHARLGEMLTGAVETWVKAPSGYSWDVMRVRVVAVSDATESGGLMSVDVELAEIASDV